jgi:hypothetical protein
MVVFVEFRVHLINLLFKIKNGIPDFQFFFRKEHDQLSLERSLPLSL